MMKHKIPMNIQFFADGGDDGKAEENKTGQQAAQPAFDYDKLASIITGKQTVAEDTVLKNYFKQQGMSQEEMTQAIASFKERKAKNTPDVNAIQTQLTQATDAAKKATVEKEAVMQALSLGIDSKTIPYVIKLADLDNSMGEDGKVNAESVKTALNKVLEDIPNLKPQAQAAGGFKIGASGGDGKNQATEEQLNAAFGV